MTEQCFATTTFWGEHNNGIIDSISSTDKTVYLTFDACDNGFDKKILDYLVSTKTPATIFMTGRWIDANQKTFQEIAKNPLFKIENHGSKHKPASTDGKSIYNLHGTQTKSALISEIKNNADKIETLTGVRPNWYRSGAAYYDDGAIEIITKELKLKISGFAISIDSGATLPSDAVYKNVMAAKPGDILLGHICLLYTSRCV